MSDPHMAAVQRYCAEIVQAVKAGHLAQADALAVLTADIFALSLQSHVAPDTADALLAMAQAFAVQRYALVNAAAAAATLPDTPAGLDEEPQ